MNKTPISNDTVPSSQTCTWNSRVESRETGPENNRRNTDWPKLEERNWEHIIIRYAHYT